MRKILILMVLVSLSFASSQEVADEITVDDFISEGSVYGLIHKTVYPNLKDNQKRITLFFTVNFISIILVDFIAGTLLEYTLENVNYTIRFEILLQIILISSMTIAIYEVIYFYVRLKNQ